MSITPEKTNGSSSAINTPIQITSLDSSCTTPKPTLECPICLCSISTTDEDVTTTKCKHSFHKKCLLESKIKLSSVCPMCRTNLSPPPVYFNPNMTNIPTFPMPSIEEQIVNSARRGRNAVRLALQRQMLAEAGY